MISNIVLKRSKILFIWKQIWYFAKMVICMSRIAVLHSFLFKNYDFISRGLFFSTSSQTITLKQLPTF